MTTAAAHTANSPERAGCSPPILRLLPSRPHCGEPQRFVGPSHSCGSWAVAASMADGFAANVPERPMIASSFRRPNLSVQIVELNPEREREFGQFLEQIKDWIEISWTCSTRRPGSWIRDRRPSQSCSRSTVSGWLTSFCGSISAGAHDDFNCASALSRSQRVTAIAITFVTSLNDDSSSNRADGDCVRQPRHRCRLRGRDTRWYRGTATLASDGAEGGRDVSCRFQGTVGFVRSCERPHRRTRHPTPTVDSRTSGRRP